MPPARPTRRRTATTATSGAAWSELDGGFPATCRGHAAMPRTCPDGRRLDHDAGPQARERPQGLVRDAVRAHRPAAAPLVRGADPARAVAPPAPGRPAAGDVVPRAAGAAALR